MPEVFIYRSGRILKAKVEGVDKAVGMTRLKQPSAAAPKIIYAIDFRFQRNSKFSPEM